MNETQLGQFGGLGAESTSDSAIRFVGAKSRRGSLVGLVEGESADVLTEKSKQGGGELGSRSDVE